MNSIGDKTRPTKSSIKESFDNLPSGVSFFNKNGMLILCNRMMYRLVFALTGKDLQSAFELRHALQNLPEGSSAIQDQDNYLLPDGTVWRFEEKTVTDQYGSIYIQFIAADVTQLHHTSKELTQRNQELIEMAEQTQHITQNLAAILREEEILSMKMRIHSEVGSSVLNLHRYYADGCREEQKTELIQNLRKTIALLLGEIHKEEETDVYQELLEAATAIGVEMIITGELPQNRFSAELLSTALRECLTNTVRHAEGNKLFVTVTKTSETIIVRITNNGKAPQSHITEGGGLSNLRTRIQSSGGEMTVQSLPTFGLTIKIPLKGEDG